MLTELPDLAPRSGLGLRVKLVSGVTIIMLVVVVGMTFVLLDYNRLDLLQQFAVEALATAQNTASALEALAETSQGQLSPYQAAFLAERALRSPNIGAVVVVDARGQALAPPEAEPSWGDAQDVFATGQVRLVQRDPATDEPLIRATAPIMGEGGLLGAVQVEMSLAALKEEFRYSRAHTIKIIAIECLIIIVFTSMILNIIVIRPVYRLARATQEIADGNLDERVEIVTTDEIGHLARSFNQMTARLRRSREKVEEQLASLEEANRELQLAHKELIASEKQASIGRLAAGVAHEIGNPLSSLLGFTEILLMGAGSKEDRQQCLNDMQGEIQRISRIVRDLLDFSRQRELQLEPVSINPILERTWRLLSTLPEFKEVEVRLDLANGLPQVFLDENLLQQVATNIMVNAAQAMDGSGALSVVSRHGDQGVTIAFHDTGPGIAPDVMEHIFEPFFTTKEVGVGTGLGLSVSQNLIAKCGGLLTAENTTEGVRFEIAFPPHTLAQESS